MAKYSLAFKKSVAKDLRNIPNKDVKHILKSIELLCKNPSRWLHKTLRTGAV